MGNFNCRQRGILIVVHHLQHGQILNASNLAGDLGISRNTVISYLNILEQTFLLYRINSYARKFKARLMKAPKIYLFDAGLINHGTRHTSLEAIKAANRQGFLEEGLLISQILAITKEMSVPQEVYYLRDYQGYEVDFILEGVKLVGIEVTSENNLRKKRYVNLTHFTEQFKMDRVFIVGRFQEVSWEKIGSSLVTLLPAWLAW